MKVLIKYVYGYFLGKRTMYDFYHQFALPSLEKNALWHLFGNVKFK